VTGKEFEDSQFYKERGFWDEVGDSKSVFTRDEDKRPRAFFAERVGRVKTDDSPLVSPGEVKRNCFLVNECLCQRANEG